ncbi:hypothetical protein BaRGS_00028541 [Batillaria attramentaria]|uniref:CARD domain-containing protein n=1 Tax=Batillaria attramentaria TaxID=370345 RepID=A0ABD0K0B6_9CAEN
MSLNIQTERELGDMMRELLPEFVRVVDPREDGFLDTLYASYLLTDTDNESLSGKDVLTRKDQARKLWFILNKIPLEDFMSKVAPELCSKYGHIIPQRFRHHGKQDDTEVKQVMDQCSGQKCLRHAVQSRIRATSMADMLYNKGFLDLEDYGDVISGTYETEAVWMAMFGAFCERSESDIENLLGGLRDLLNRYNVRIAADLKDVVSMGLPCTCDEPVPLPPCASSVPVTKVGSWLRKTRFSFGRSSVTSRARSPGSSRTIMPASSYSPATTRRTFDTQSIASEDTLTPENAFNYVGGDADEQTEKGENVSNTMHTRERKSCIPKGDKIGDSLLHSKNASESLRFEDTGYSDNAGTVSIEIHEDGFATSFSNGNSFWGMLYDIKFQVVVTVVGCFLLAFCIFLYTEMSQQELQYQALRQYMIGGFNITDRNFNLIDHKIKSVISFLKNI